jgi:hypothetical protein
LPRFGSLFLLPDEWGIAKPVALALKRVERQIHPPPWALLELAGMPEVSSFHKFLLHALHFIGPAIGLGRLRSIGARHHPRNRTAV